MWTTFISVEANWSTYIVSLKVVTTVSKCNIFLL